jgi:PAS domain S-box-containing protein
MFGVSAFPDMLARKDLRLRKEGPIGWAGYGMDRFGRDAADDRTAVEPPHPGEAGFRTLADHVSDAFFLYNADGVILDVNRHACESLGYTREELIGTRSVGIDASRAHPSREEIASRFAAGRDVRFDTRLRRKDGSVFPVEVCIFPFRDGSQGLYVVQAHDISERQRTEGTLRRLNRQLNALSSCAQVLMRATNEQDLLDDVCRTICDAAGYRMAWVGYAEHDAARTVRPVAQFGFEDGYLDSIGISWADTPQGRGPTGVAIRTGIVQINHDFQDNPLMTPWRDEAISRGYRASIALPLKQGDDLLACLAIYAGEPDAFAADEVSLLEELADNLAFGIDVLRMRDERRQAEQALRESEERYRTIFQNMPLGIFRSTVEGRFLELNPAMARMLGYDSPAEALREITDIGAQVYVHAGDRQAIVDRQLGVAGDAMQYLSHYRSRDGRQWVASLYLKTIRDAGGQPMFFDGIVEDITDRMQSEEERERLQAQLIQAQKMESIGRLAGGIAHDFNNVLSAIIGYSELALRDASPSGRLYEHLQEIRKAADRSVDLTRQLLAFARKQTVLPRVVDLNETVAGLLQLLRRMIGEGIDLDWQPGAHIWPVKVDPGQIDQILANLCVNARDAIEGMGRIIIETRNVVLDEAYVTAHAGAVPGEYVLLAVRDNGPGMVREALEHAFEPFFTTKDVGKGTGLGLATVYGIVKQNNGYIDLDSESGRGTSVSIYLPRHTGEAAQPEEDVPEQTVAHGDETILLVEDEPVILEIARLILEKCGYRMLTASRPDEALRIVREHGREIQMLITDVIMPGMNGRELADAVLKQHPDMRCLFMSGYSGNAIAQHGMLDADVHFIQKPFSTADLTAKVRSVLDGD